MFRSMLSNLIRSEAEVAIKTGAVSTPVRIVPSGLDSWDALTPPQQLRKVVSRFMKKLDQLSDLECLQMVSREAGVTGEVLAITSQLAALDMKNARNPTLLLLAEAVARAVKSGKPIDMFASLCLEKGPGVRDGKLDWFLEGKRRDTPDVLASTASVRGWSTIKRILTTVDYPVRVRFLHRGSRLLSRRWMCAVV